MKKSYEGHMRFLVRKAYDTKEQAKTRKHKNNPHSLMTTAVHCMQDPKIILPFCLLLCVAAPVAAGGGDCQPFTCYINGPQKGVMVKPGQQNNIGISCSTRNDHTWCTGDFQLDCQFSSGNGKNALGSNTNITTFFAANSEATCLQGCGPTQQAKTTILARTENSNDKYRYSSLTVQNHGSQTMAARCAVSTDDASRSSYKRS